MKEKLEALDKIFSSASKTRFKKPDQMMEDDGLMTIKIVTSDPSKMEEIKKMLSQMGEMGEGMPEMMEEEEEETEEEYMV